MPNALDELLSGNNSALEMMPQIENDKPLSMAAEKFLNLDTTIKFIERNGMAEYRRMLQALADEADTGNPFKE